MPLTAEEKKALIEQESNNFLHDLHADADEFWTTLEPSRAAILDTARAAVLAARIRLEWAKKRLSELRDDSEQIRVRAEDGLTELRLSEEV